MYLQSIHIVNFRGIKDMTVHFNSKLNVIIGANSHYKTTLIDAIRLFYTMGKQKRDIEITLNDFHVNRSVGDDGNVRYLSASQIIIGYTFAGLSDDQKAALYQYLVVGGSNITAYAEINYTLDNKGKITLSYVTGKSMKADYETFQYFKSYYLSALRDSTRDLQSTRNNPLGKVIKRKVNKSNHEEEIKGLLGLQQIIEF